MRILTIKSLILTLALLGSSINIAAQQETMFGQFTSPGQGTMLSVLHDRVAFSKVTWYFDGSVTTCSFKLEKSANGSTWADLTAVQDCSSSGNFKFVTPIIGKFIRYNIVTHSGGGTLNILWEGFTGQQCGFDYSGVFSTVVGADPIAGVELTTTIPSSERWRVYSASFELQADGTLEDREVFLTASDNGSEYFRTFADGVVKADQKGIFTTAALGFVGTTGLGPSSIHQPADVRTILIPIYSDAFIPGGHTLATITNGIQTGDDYSAPVLLVERCPN